MAFKQRIPAWFDGFAGLPSLFISHPSKITIDEAADIYDSHPAYACTNLTVHEIQKHQMNVAGAYMFLSSGNAIYAGMSYDIYSRITQHMQRSAWVSCCDSVLLYVTSTSMAETVESWMITSMKPKENKKPGKYTESVCWISFSEDIKNGMSFCQMKEYHVGIYKERMSLF